MRRTLKPAKHLIWNVLRKELTVFQQGSEYASQKQSPRGDLKKRCSWEFSKIYRKRPVPESHF